MSVLLEMAQALARIDNKINRFYDDVVPIIAEATRDARAIQFDKNILNELIRECSHPDRTVIREANIKFATGQAQQLYARGDRHPNVVALKEARDLLPHVGAASISNKAKQDFVQSKLKEPDPMLIAKLVSQNVNKKLMEVESAVQKAIRVAGEVSNLRVELESSIADKVDKVLQTKFNDLESKETGQLMSLKDRLKVMEADVRKGHFGVVQQQQLLDQKTGQIEKDIEAYERRIQAALQRVAEGITSDYRDIEHKIELHEQSRERTKREMLKVLFEKQRVFLEDISKSVEAESAQIKRTVEEAVKKIRESKVELEALADKTKEVIISVDKTKAQLGNLIPQPRRRIRNTNG